MKLTARQCQVIKLVTDGLKNKEIGKQLGIGEMVVKNYLRVIFDETGMSSRLELALWHLSRTEPQ